MKILQINKFHYLRGGAERHYLELSELLKSHGHEVIHFSMNDSRNEFSKYGKYFAKQVNLEKFSLVNIFKIFYNFDAQKKLDSLLEAERPDIVHMHNIYHQLSPAIINTIKKHNIPMVMTLHDYKIICPNYQLFSQGKICNSCIGQKYYNCLLKKCAKNSYKKSLLAMLEAYLHNVFLKTYEKVDLFITPSDYLRNTCIKFGVNSNKIQTLNNFTNLGNINNQRDFSNKHDKSYYLYFGRISEEKGIDVLIDAFSDHKSSLIIVGTGPDYKKYSEIIESRNITNIKLVGPKYGDSLKNIINNATAVIVPSIWPENMPLTILEAMALKKPIIVTNIGGIKEIIEHGVNGFLFKLGDVNDLKFKIMELSNYNLKEIGENAYLKAKSFNKQDYYNSIAGIYSKLIELKKQEYAKKNSSF